jgi:hypothetical protein
MALRARKPKYYKALPLQHAIPTSKFKQFIFSIHVVEFCIPINDFAGVLLAMCFYTDPGP